MALLSTRRQVLAASVAAALPDLPRAAAQTDGFRVIRARDDGYNGTVPGPILRIRRGEELRVRLVNELSVETAIHWHGVRVPNAMDGTWLTQKPVAPGASFDYRFTPPDAGTFWYRPPVRAPQNRALAGLLIVQDKTPPKVDDDVAVLIESTDSGFTANGLARLDIPLWPKHRLRLRLANATEDIVTLRIDGHPMHVVAIDGQPAEPFLARESRITLAPGNRTDVFIDAVMKPGTTAPILARMGDADVTLAQLVYGDGAVPPGATMSSGFAGEPVKALEPNPLPERMDFRGALRVDLDPNAGDAAAPPKPLFSVKRGRTVQLAIKNGAARPAVLHIHGHHVRLLDALDDGWKPFWLDTIPCLPQRTTRVAFIADNPGKWLLASRAIGAAAQSVAWFEVT